MVWSLGTVGYKELTAEHSVDSVLFLRRPAQRSGVPLSGVSGEQSNTVDRPMTITGILH